MFARRIKNVTGTSRRRGCACGSWLEHYRTHGGTGDACVVCGARRRIGGGHVWVKQSLLYVINWRELGEHIVPLCAACNGQPDWMDTKIAFALVSANTQRMGCALRA